MPRRLRIQEICACPGDQRARVKHPPAGRVWMPTELLATWKAVAPNGATIKTYTVSSAPRNPSPHRNTDTNPIPNPDPATDACIGSCLFDDGGHLRDDNLETIQSCTPHSSPRLALPTAGHGRRLVRDPASRRVQFLRRQGVRGRARHIRVDAGAGGRAQGVVGQPPRHDRCASAHGALSLHRSASLHPELCRRHKTQACALLPQH